MSARGSARRERRGAEIAKTIRNAFAEVWGQWTGRVGLLILFVVVAISVYAAATMPPDLVDRWKNTPWPELPDFVPPEWVSYFGVPVAKHIIYKDIEPIVPALGTVRPVREYDVAIGIKPLPHLIGYLEVYRVDYELDQEAFPKGIVVFFEPVSNTSVVRRGAQEFTVTVTALLLVKRPDEAVVIVAASPPTPVADLKSLKVDPAAFSTGLAGFFRERYGVEVPPGTIQTKPIEYVFGRPVGAREVVPLTGTYELILVLVYSGVDPNTIQGAVRAGALGYRSVEIIVKGSAYGWLGTDTKSRDLALGVLYGFPVALLVGFFAAVSVVGIGLLAGVVSGYYGGAVDEAIQRTVDVLANVPLLPILVLIGAIVQGMPELTPWHRLFIIIGFLVIFSWGGMAIIVRSMTLSIKAEPYIEAARAVGASNARIILRHILPQIMPYAMASLVFTVPSAIITEAGLSVLGIEHGLPTWGRILSDALADRGVSYKAWWWIFPPGGFMALTALAFVLIGLAIETIVEPRLRRR